MVDYDQNDSSWRFWHTVVWLIIGIILCLCFGCTRHVYVPVVHERVDSVSVHDTIMQVQLVPYKDSVATRDTSSYLHNEYAYSYAMWSGGVLHHSLGIWPQKPIEIKVPHFIDRWHYEKVPEIVEVERKLTRWQQFKMDHDPISAFMVGAVFGALALYIRGRFKKR